MDKLLPFPEKDAELYSIYAELGELYDLKARVERLIQHHTQRIDEVKDERNKAIEKMKQGGRDVNDTYPIPIEPLQYATVGQISELMERLELTELCEPLIKRNDDEYTCRSVPE